MFFIELFAMFGTIIAYYYVTNGKRIGLYFQIGACSIWIVWGILVGSQFPFLFLQIALITISIRRLFYVE